MLNEILTAQMLAPSTPLTGNLANPSKHIRRYEGNLRRASGAVSAAQMLLGDSKVSAFERRHLWTSPNNHEVERYRSRNVRPSHSPGSTDTLHTGRARISRS